MSESAFGVDHGSEVSKAFGSNVAAGLKKIGTTLQGGLKPTVGGAHAGPSPMQAGVQNAAAKMKPMGAKLAANKKPLAAGAAVGSASTYSITRNKKPGQ